MDRTVPPDPSVGPPAVVAPVTDDVEVRLRPGVTARVPAPVGWTVHTPSVDGVALLLTAPADPGHFAANVVLATDDLPAGTSLRDWQRTVDLTLPRVLHDAVVLDLERVSVGARPGVRRLLHHVTEAGDAVTAEQWATVVGDLGLTLTTTVPTLLWADDGVALRSVAEGLVIEGPTGEGATAEAAPAADGARPVGDGARPAGDGPRSAAEREEDR